MKKHLIVIGMTLVLLIVGFCGCVEKEETQNEQNEQDEQDEQNEDYDDNKFKNWVSETQTKIYNRFVYTRYESDEYGAYLGEWKSNRAFIDGKMDELKQSNYFLSPECEEGKSIVNDAWGGYSLGCFYRIQKAHYQNMLLENPDSSSYNDWLDAVEEYSIDAVNIVEEANDKMDDFWDCGC